MCGKWFKTRTRKALGANSFFWRSDSCKTGKGTFCPLRLIHAFGEATTVKLVGGLLAPLQLTPAFGEITTVKPVVSLFSPRA